MVLLGASSLLGCSGCVCGSKDGCCGAGPSLTAARERLKQKKRKKNQRTVIDVCFMSHFLFLWSFSTEGTALAVTLQEAAGDVYTVPSKVIGGRIKNQMFLRAAACHLKLKTSSFKKYHKTSRILSPSLYVLLNIKNQ